jgi:hypothetical protein
VNFFGHAALAFYERNDSGFILGSMLPDFATMIRARPPAADHTALAQGIAYHHRTDQVFHDAEPFRRLCHSSFAALEALGVRRGSARAVAHIGVEMLLDGVLARDAQVCSAYARALEQSRESTLGQHVRWRDEAERLRFGELSAALQRRGVLGADESLEVLVWRLTRALHGRPRLELRSEDEARVLRWAEDARSQVEVEADPLLRAVRDGLRSP